MCFYTAEQLNVAQDHELLRIDTVRLCGGGTGGSLQVADLPMGYTLGYEKANGCPVQLSVSRCAAASPWTQGPRDEEPASGSTNQHSKASSTWHRQLAPMQATSLQPCDGLSSGPGSRLQLLPRQCDNHASAGDC